VGALGLLTLLCGLFYAFDAFALVNGLAPVLLATILLVADWKLVRRVPAAVWTPLFAFRLGSAILLGVGSALLQIFDPATIEYESLHYFYAEAEAAKVNIIWVLSSFLAIGGAWIVGVLSAARPPRTQRPGLDSTLITGVVFYAIGFGFFLLIELPQGLGYFTLLIPGSLLALFQALNAVGLFLIAHWAFDRGRGGVAIIALLFFANLVVGLIGLNKTIVMLPQLLISLAYLMKRVTAGRVALVALLMMVALAVLQPLVAYGREQHMGTHGEEAGGTIGERLGYSIDWLRGERTISAQESESINPLVRLSYLGPAAYVVGQYDANQPSATITDALAALVPRVLWPDKPHTTAVSREVFYQLTGREGSAVGTTVAADVYWNYGWTGVALIFPLLGMVMMGATTLCYQLVVRRNWFMMPFVLMSFRVALGVDGQFVPNIFAPGAIAVVMYVALHLMLGLLPHGDSHVQRPALR
jgi:hypothetical protein